MKRKDYGTFLTIKDHAIGTPSFEADTAEDKMIAAYCYFREVGTDRSELENLIPRDIQIDLAAIMQASQNIVREYAMTAENLIRLNQIADHLDSIKRNSNSKMSEKQKLHQADKQRRLEAEAVTSFNCIVKSKMQIEVECDEMTDAASVLAHELQQQITQTTNQARKQLSKAVQNATRL